MSCSCSNDKRNNEKITSIDKRRAMANQAIGITMLIMILTFVINKNQVRHENGVVCDIDKENLYVKSLKDSTVYRSVYRRPDCDKFLQYVAMGDTLRYRTYNNKTDVNALTISKVNSKNVNDFYNQRKSATIRNNIKQKTR